MLWWYLGDGHLRRKKSRPNYRRIELATDSFSLREINLLIKKLKAILDDENVYEESREICLSRTSIGKFAQIIGSVSPAKCYQYKFEFGMYTDPNYFKKSYSGRPIESINKYRKKHKVRELDYELVKQETGANDE